MADRYWVGGSGTWNTTNTTNWSTADGGAGGASVPTSTDDVYFTPSSGTGTVTVSGTVVCQGLLTGLFGITNLGFSASGATIQAYTFFELNGVSGGFTGNPAVQLLGGLDGSLEPSGRSLGPITVNKTSGSVAVYVGGAVTSTVAITITQGTFTTNDYNVTAASLSSSNTNTRTINLGSSTVTLQGAGAVKVNFATSTGLTFNAGTSSIVISTGGTQFDGGGRTFYNVSYTSTTSTSWTVNGANTFNNLTIAGITSSGVNAVSISADQTINGTLTLSAGTNATMRTFVRSNTIGTTRTLTCAAVASLTDIDFRDITIAGAAAPVSGTRLGDCKGNSGITFDTAKTVYWNLVSGGNWSADAWATAGGGTPATNNFPLAQDTAIFQSTGLNSAATVTINAAYNIGTIDMSARTSNTMTLATGTQQPAIYGNWINGTGTTLTGTGVLTFAGRGSQTITSAGRTFTQQFTVDTPSGSVTLQDAFTSTIASTVSLVLSRGTLDANGYSVTFATGGFNGSTTFVRALALGLGTWTFGASGNAFNLGTSTNLTVTGTGTISLTSASAKTFAGGGIQTYPTINQGGVGTLTITGSNKFANITNTAIGRVQFTGGTTNEFGAFNLNGVSGNLLQVGSTNTTQAILKKPGAWNVGANSTDAGNNTGLSFTAGTVDYLSVSYINGQVSAAPVTSYLGNFFAFF